jgi:uncharacterized membrane protein
MAEPATPILPAHIEETVQAIARLHAEHYQQSSTLQRAVDRITGRVGRPQFVAWLTMVVVGWIGLNLGLIALGRTPIDAPPFFWLQGAVTLTALYVAALILSTQRREDQLGAHREQLTLELSIISERKAAKIIALLEEIRRDSPTLRNRHDAEASELSAPADPQAVLGAIMESHQDMIEAEAALDGEPLAVVAGPEPRPRQQQMRAQG